MGLSFNEQRDFISGCRQRPCRPARRAHTQLSFWSFGVSGMLSSAIQRSDAWRVVLVNARANSTEILCNETNNTPSPILESRLIWFRQDRRWRSQWFQASAESEIYSIEQRVQIR